MKKAILILFLLFAPLTLLLAQRPVYREIKGNREMKGAPKEVMRSSKKIQRELRRENRAAHKEARMIRKEARRTSKILKREMS